MPKRTIIFAVIVIGALIVLFFYNKYRKAPEINFKDINLTDTEANPFDFNSLKGRNVVVCFYASWCGPCNDELKALNVIKNAELPDVEIICITDEPFEKLIEFKETRKYPFTFLKMQQSFEQIKVVSIPTSYLLNKNLEIVFEQVGEIEWKDPSTLNHLKSLFAN